MNFAVLNSGGGGYAKFIYHNLGLLPNAAFSLMITDRDCGGYRFFKDHTAIPTILLDYPSFASKEAFEQAVLRTLTEHRIDFIFLNYNRLIGPVLLEHFPRRIFNLHLSLLPLFTGFQAVEKAFASDMLFAGSTVHLINSQPDAGPIIGQMVTGKNPQESLDGFRHRHFQNTAVLFADIIYKLANDVLIPLETGYRFENADYGGTPFNPSLSIDPDRVRFEP